MEFKLILEELQPDMYVLRIEDKEKLEGIYVSLDMRNDKHDAEFMACRINNAARTLQKVAQETYGKAVAS